jgi:glutathione synthase/RimK-type ligase-like ATP-grasp enzyme
MTKNKIILVGIHGRPSLKNTYSKMENKDTILYVRRRITKKNKEWFRKYTNGVSDRFEKKKILDVSFKNSIIVRWGNAIQIDNDNSCIVYNEAKAISLASNKKKSREVFIEKGIKTPRLVNPNSSNINYPVIARPSTHAKGSNFVTLNNLDEFRRHYDVNYRNGWYYSEFIDKVREFRIHCAHGKILNYLEKPNPKNGSIAWNRARNGGEAFENVKWADYNMACGTEAIRATFALGLDFAGIDVMLDKDGNAWVLEANTSPTLNSSEYSMQRYSMYFDWLFRSNTKRKHWDIANFKKPQSLAWKNYQLLDKNETDENSNN